MPLRRSEEHTTELHSRVEFICRRLPDLTKVTVDAVGVNVSSERLTEYIDLHSFPTRRSSDLSADIPFSSNCNYMATHDPFHPRQCNFRRYECEQMKLTV